MPDQVSTWAQLGWAEDQNLGRRQSHTWSLLLGFRAGITDTRQTTKGMERRTSTQLELGFSTRPAANHTELPQQPPSEQTWL